MGLFYTRDKDGFLQGFNIKGDAPSETEQARIDAHINGTPAPVPPPSDNTGITTALGRGVLRNIDEYQAGALRIAQGLAANVGKDGKFAGKTPEEYEAMIQEQYRQRDTVPVPEGGFFDQKGAYDKTKYLATTAGESASGTLGGVGGALAGAAVGSVVPGLGTLIGAGIGGLAGNIIGGAPQMFDENARRQIDQNGYVKDWSKAATATAGQVAVETLTDLVTAKAAGIIGKPLSAVAEEAVKRGVSKGLLQASKRIGGGAAGGGVAGGVEEAVQEALTRWNADQSLTDDQAKADYLENAIVGGILQGAIGGALGTVEATSEARTRRAEAAAAKDAEEEAAGLSNAQANVAKTKSAQPAGFIADMRSDLPAGLIESPEAIVDRDSRDPFSQPEYNDAVEKLRGQKVSPDKIKNLMNIGRPKANAIFEEMRNRGDGEATGSSGQYLRVPPRAERSYEVAQVTEAEDTPFEVFIKDKPRGGSFKTKEEAQSWAERAGVSEFEVRDVTAKSRPFGVYETSKTADGASSTRRLVKKFNTPQEANAAVREIDPTFIGAKDTQTERVADRVSAKVEETLGPIAVQLKSLADKIVGPNRVQVQLTPSVDANYLRGIGVREENLPAPGVIIEGVTMPDVKNPVKSVIGLSQDIYDPNLSKVEKAQRLNNVLTHELVHAMRNLDLLTKPEWDALTAYAFNNKKGDKPYTYFQWAKARSPKGTQNLIEESVAEMLRHYMANPAAFDRSSRSIVRKLADFIRNLLSLGKNNNAEDVMRSIFGGDVGKRDVGSGGMSRYPGDPFYSSVIVPTYYLKTDKYLENSKQEKATPDQWMGMLRNAGVKDEELDWLGIEDWMKEQKVVTRGDLMDFVRANAIDIKEKIRGGPEPVVSSDDYLRQIELDRRLSELNRSLSRRFYALPDGELLEWNDLSDEMYREDSNTPPRRIDPFLLWMEDQYRNQDPMAVEYSNTKGELDELSPKVEREEPSHPGTTQQGGKDYTEVLLYLPTIKPAFFVNAHFGGFKNIIASARFKERDFGDNKRTMFIEEIQSDIHQQGRKNGYREKGWDEKNLQLYRALEDAAKAQAAANDDARYWAKKMITAGQQIVNDPDSADFWQEEYEKATKEHQNASQKRIEVTAAFDKLNDEYEKQLTSVPNAPFKTTWDEFAFKRLVRHAVEKGFDQIAWHGDADSVAETEGYHHLTEQQDSDGNTRYVNLYDPENSDDGVDVTGIVNFYTQRLRNVVNKAFKKFNTGVRFEPSAVPPFDYDQFFESPNDMASFVANVQVDRPTAKKLATAIQISYQQRAFDPKAAFDKAGVTENDLRQMVEIFFPQEFRDASVDENGNPRHDKWVMPISEELRKATMEQGFPMFSALTEEKIRAVSDTPAFRKWFEGSVVVDDAGLPQVMFHGTLTDNDFAEFHPLTHFGTAGAATDRIESFAPQGSTGLMIGERLGIPYNKINDWWVNLSPEERERLHEEQHAINREKMTRSRMYPVFLSIKNPLEIADRGYNHDLNEYIYLAKEEGAISFMDAALIQFGGKKMLIKILKDKGYDGFAYTNASEDMMSRSYVAFEPEQVKSIFNRGTWNANDPRFNYSSVYEGPRYAAAAPVGQRVPVSPTIDQLTDLEAKITYDNIAPAVKKIASYMVPKNRINLGLFATPSREQINEGIDSSFINLQDRMLPIGRLIDRVRQNGGVISNENDPYLRDTLFHGQTKAKIEDNDRGFYTPLIDAMKALNVTQADRTAAIKINRASKAIVENYSDPKKAIAELYLYAQHALERNAEMRRRNDPVQGERFEQYESGSGITDPEAREILAWINAQRFANQLSDLSNANSLRSRMRALIAETNRIRVDGGLNPDYALMQLTGGLHAPQYQDYVPLRSWIEEHMDQDDDAQAFARTGKGYNIKGKEDQSALGRTSIASDILANSILQNEEAIVRAEKNKVGQSFLKLVEDNPAQLDGVARIIAKMPTKFVYDTKTGLVKSAPDPSIIHDPMVLRVKRDAKQFYIRFTDPRIAKAMGSRSGLGNAGAGAIMQSMMALNRFLAATRTSYNPEFVVSNMLRDLQTGTLNLSELELAGLRREVISNLPAALKGSWEGIRSGNMSTEWARTFDEFRKRGGMTAYYGRRELEDTIKKINSHMKEDPSGADPRRVLKQLGALRDFIEDLNAMVENGIRLSTYKSLRDRFLAMTPDPTSPVNIKRAQERAAERAKNLTVNFNAGGEWKPFMNAMYLFYNAGISGSAAMINPFIRSRKVKKLWAGVLLAGLLQDQLMSLLSPSDDDGQKIYDKIPAYTLEHNIVFLDPFQLSERGYFQIPIPYLMNSIYNFGRAMSRGARGAYTPGETINSALGTLTESLNPWGGSNNWLNFVAPTILDPVVDLYTNNNFADAPIAPPANPFGLSENASQRYWNNTSPAYVTISDWISRITGGDGDFIPGAVEWSPNQIEYIVEWLGGGSTTFLTRTYDFFSPVASKNVLGEIVSGGEWSANDVPILRKAYGNITTKNDLQSYIAGRDQVLRVRKEMQSAVEAGDSQRYQYLIREFPEEYRIANSINKIENQRKKLSGRIRKIRASTTISDARKEELVKELKARQEEYVSRANTLLAGLR